MRASSGGIVSDLPERLCYQQYSFAFSEELPTCKAPSAKLLNRVPECNYHLVDLRVKLCVCVGRLVRAGFSHLSA